MFIDYMSAINYKTITIVNHNNVFKNVRNLIVAAFS